MEVQREGWARSGGLLLTTISEPRLKLQVPSFPPSEMTCYSTICRKSRWHSRLELEPGKGDPGLLVIDYSS